MRRFLTYMLALTMTGSVAVMAQKATTADDLDKAMKKVSTTQQAVNKAIQSNAFADAKKQVAVVKTALVDAENFWVVNKKDDAIKMSKETIAKVDALDKALSAPAPDAAAVTAAFKEVGATCGACHRAYRATDANNAFIVKPGSI